MLHRKNWMISCLISILLIGNSISYGQGSKARSVLFLGNSVFYFKGGFCQTFEGFCKESNLDIQVVSQRKEPSKSHGVGFLEYGRIPVNLPDIAADEQLHSLIRSGDFDYVIVEARREGHLLSERMKLPGYGMLCSHHLPKHHFLQKPSLLHGCQS